MLPNESVGRLHVFSLVGLARRMLASSHRSFEALDVVNRLITLNLAHEDDTL